MEEEKKPLLFTSQETSFNVTEPPSRSYGSSATDQPNRNTDGVPTGPHSPKFMGSEHLYQTTNRGPTGPHSSQLSGSDHLNQPANKLGSLDIVGLSYYVTERVGHWWKGSCLKPAKRKTVLHNLCMSFNSGELTALVGSSGSGKTSLLDVISGRATGESVGVVSYKHEQCTRRLMKQKASYVLQADRLLPTLTARETLTFMAFLILTGKYTAKDIDKKVQGVLNDMGLSKVADSKIGGSVMRGVSGGEKRRITIAIQLLKDPEIILLDEPTTGLDALTARNLVSSMAELARNGKLVIMSIHQPRSDIVKVLDRIALMTVGQLAYFGKPDQLVPYFTNIGFPCPKNENPCDIYVDVVSVDRRSPSRERSTMERARTVCTEFAHSDMQTQVVKNITLGFNFLFDEGLAPEVQQTTPWIRKFHTLLVRMNLNLTRNRSALIMRVFETLMAVPFIIMFLGRLKSNQGSIQDRFGVTYQAINVPPFMGVTNAISLFPELQTMMYRENHDGLYSIPTFLLAYYVHILPFTIIAIALYAPALYWVVGLKMEFYAFGAFALMSFILEQFADLLAVAMLALFLHPQVAYNTSILIFSMASLIASGLLIPIDNMPVFFQWLSYIPITRYATEIVVGNEFHDLELTCQNITGATCHRRGDEVLDQYYPDAVVNMSRNFGIMGGYIFAVLIFAWMMFQTRRVPTMY